ncbi:hypothetical protein EX30DRAFT_340013 [Ascodesmis nigricans]|uniref:Letm1 RBD domain-containing protein n=1 Tax=Ascodesmis nigricans TaxID=341454 RepID=A0A4S2MZN3_9PEZI|nr:hypothetical protein EX30DRAFT_340013 [Ascodesmis nigricans]
MASARLLLRPVYGPACRLPFAASRAPSSLRLHPRFAYTPISRHLSTTKILGSSLTPSNEPSTDPPTETTETVPSPPDPLNSPVTTLPGNLELPDRSESSSQFNHIFKIGKVYFSFFKDGMLNIFKNYKATRQLQQRIDASNGSIAELVKEGAINRSEYQHIIRTRHDIRRLPMFGVIFLIFGEMSPLLLPFVPSIVPGTCRIPRQLERERRTKKHRKDKSWPKILAMPLEKRLKTSKKSLRELTSQEVWHIAKVLGIEPRVLPLGSLARKRVERHTEYLELDDILMKRHGGHEQLDAGEELLRAVEDRGMEVTGLEEHDLREKMELYQKIRVMEGGAKPGMWLLTEGEWHQLLDVDSESRAKNAGSTGKPGARRI